MARSAENRWLFRYALFTAATTLGLICLGGLVTSHEAGLAVPDWPTTYGYNMFFFPISRWTGGIFYEHTHRLYASGVGLLTIFLAAWLWVKEERAWLRWLGIGAVVGVVLQGVLGGMRVVALKDEVGIVHATLAQLFLVLVSSIALFTSRWWREGGGKGAQPSSGLGRAYFAIAALVLFQLILGATMRHQHAGLAIPDFPLAYGGMIPATDAGSILHYNQMRTEVVGLKPITAFGVWLQMAHRLTALAIVIAIGWAARHTVRQFSRRHILGKWALVWTALVGVQFVLGAATIWTNKSADLATAHVACGALILVTGCMLGLMAKRCLQARTAPEGARKIVPDGSVAVRDGCQQPT